MFDLPDGVIEKPYGYKELGVDSFSYYASIGLGHEEQRQSLEIFAEKVLPAFN
ncbi:MAG: hypothetical protein OXI87_02755 [Albidovulum sp.]|nr:hypothetical protein [Albidovulum sp.]MDE0532383.1 hypothetical protein [Albidovulum sp.]